jgi:hypothetical protein
MSCCVRNHVVAVRNLDLSIYIGASHIEFNLSIRKYLSPQIITQQMNEFQ